MDFLCVLWIVTGNCSARCSRALKVWLSGGPRAKISPYSLSDAGLKTSVSFSSRRGSLAILRAATASNASAPCGQSSSTLTQQLVRAISVAISAATLLVKVEEALTSGSLELA